MPGIGSSDPLVMSDWLENAQFENMAHTVKSANDQVDNPVEQILGMLEPSDGQSLGRVGHYDFLKLIGRGAFGVVFNAFDRKLARQVAIKVLTPTKSSSEERCERFLKEARSAAAVRHENVVQIYAVEESPFPFIVMELVSDGTLQYHIRKNGALSPDDTVDYSIQIAKGLEAAHGKRIVHLDVKPSNILLQCIDGETRLQPKLTDFGLAFGIDEPSNFEPGVVMGTPAYMSPEQAAGSPLDHRADLFSLGSVIFAMCTGQQAFGGERTLSVFRGVLKNNRAQLPDGFDIPESMLAIINRLHSTLPQHRYDSASQVISDLSKLAHHPNDRRSLPFAKVLTVVALCITASLLALWVQSGQPIDYAQPTWREARQQLLSVTGELEALNPRFETRDCFYEIADGRVIELKLPWLVDYSPIATLTDLKRIKLTCSPDVDVVDLSFVQGMKGLETVDAGAVPLQNLKPLTGLPIRKLNIWCSYFHCPEKELDLKPLKGMPLHWLNCGGSKNVVDIKPLRDMQLESLCLNLTNVSDISSLEGMPLYTLQLNSTPVTDLSPISGAPLKILELSKSQVQNLTPLVGMKLEELFINGLNNCDLSVLKRVQVKALWLDYDESLHFDLINTIPGLERVNGKQLQELQKSTF